jgi:gamma-glutamyltranspeptidase/glutathione hydrolase
MARLNLTGFCLWICLSTGFVPRANGSPLVAETRRGAVASAHPIASQVGVLMLDRGGNAVDAAVATAFALAVVEPYSAGLGGGGFALLYDAKSGERRALDFRETAPQAATRDMYLREGAPVAALSQDGPLSVGVPGFVAGMAEMHASGGGKLPFAMLIEPAIALAAEGFPVYPMLQAHIAGSAERFNPAARAVFLAAGGPPELGTALAQPDLATTLRVLASSGPRAFYSGDLATKIVQSVQSGGGILSLADLADYAPKWREPLCGPYRGHEVCSMPPPSSGGVHLLQMLRFLEGYPLAEWGHGSARTVHALLTAMRIAYWDRARYLGDADFVAVPVAKLTSEDYAKAWRKRAKATRALSPEALVGGPTAPTEGADTTHLSVVDEQGNAVAATLTINLSFGSGWVAAETGVILNDEMDDFAAAPGAANAFGLVGSEANAIAPRKRPLSSMTPTFVFKDGALRLVTGSPGGSRIITTVLHTVLGVVDFGMSAAEAVRAPRLHHQWKPEATRVERHALSPDTQTRLEALGHVFESSSPFCNAQAISIDPRTGNREAASDWRGSGAPAAQLPLPARQGAQP